MNRDIRIVNSMINSLTKQFLCCTALIKMDFIVHISILYILTQSVTTFCDYIAKI